jgi:hypothetical protein
MDKEIVWNIVNSALAGSLVFLGAFVDGQINRIEIIASIGAAFVAGITLFRDFWNKEKPEYENNKYLFKFL